MTERAPIPVTILTGFLGAGKTTLLNFILHEQHGFRFGIIINEIGEIGIDDQLVLTQQREEIILMRNGCICCTVRKDLVRGIQQLLARGGFDYLLIETTGVADPAPIAQTFVNIPALSPYVRLDSIVTLVDAEQVERQARETPVVIRQIATADFLLLNKTDLVAEPELAGVENKLRRLNPKAEILRTSHSRVNIDDLLDMHAFDVDRKFDVEIGPLRGARSRQHHHHDIAAVAFKVKRAFDAFKFQRFVEDLSRRESVYRSKGIISVGGSKRRAIFHGVNNRFTIFWDRYWKKEEARESQLVFIGRGLSREAIERRLLTCVV